MRPAMTWRPLAAAASLAFVCCLPFAIPTTSAETSPDSLTGRVTSTGDAPMVGVVVTVQRRGEKVLTSVSTDAAGRFHFPRHRVGAGSYDVTIRAAGYVLEKAASVDVGASAPATIDLRLAAATREQLAEQLTSV